MSVTRHTDLMNEVLAEIDDEYIRQTLRPRPRVRFRGFWGPGAEAKRDAFVAANPGSKPARWSDVVKAGKP